MTRAAALPSALPYWITLSFVPLVVLAVTRGGWWIVLIPLWGWVAMPALDLILGRDLRNPDPATPDAQLFWFRLLTWIWFPIEAALVFGGIWYLTTRAGFPWWEDLAVMFAIGSPPARSGSSMRTSCSTRRTAASAGWATC